MAGSIWSCMAFLTSGKISQFLQFMRVAEVHKCFFNQVRNNNDGVLLQPSKRFRFLQHVCIFAYLMEFYIVFMGQQLYFKKANCVIAYLSLENRAALLKCIVLIVEQVFGLNIVHFGLLL